MDFQLMNVIRLGSRAVQCGCHVIAAMMISSSCKSEMHFSGNNNRELYGKNVTLIKTNIDLGGVEEDYTIWQLNARAIDHR